jgi:hypothetical protein
MKQLPEPVDRLTPDDWAFLSRTHHLATHAKSYAEILQMPQGTLIRSAKPRPTVALYPSRRS